MIHSNSSLLVRCKKSYDSNVYLKTSMTTLHSTTLNKKELICLCKTKYKLTIFENFYDSFEQFTSCSM